MKKLLFVLLVGTFVLGSIGMAFAANPTVIGANGASTFTYKDLQDASAKYEGGYAAFNNLAGTGYASNGASYSVNPAADIMAGFGPHGGYDTASNKCKVCHAVHRAEGAYYLLRADSQDDACDYCHIGGSAHSSKVVYTANPAGTATTNGHTIGAQAQVPDSTTDMSTTPVLVQTLAADGVTVISDTIDVRQYNPAKNQMYRLEPYAHGTAGHPLESGIPTWARVGPFALRCMNCHQVHDALALVWRPKAFNTSQGTTDSAGYLKYGWNLLRRYPSAAVSNAVTSTAKTGQLVKVPETALTTTGSADSVGGNYSAVASKDGMYTENGISATRPIWVVSEGWSGMGAQLPLPSATTDPRTVSNLTLAVWCADCHTLNIGGTQEMAPELGFHAHAERTHPDPYAHGGQCYSCHQADLATAGYGANGNGGPNLTSCSRCHFSQSNYNVSHANADFPHSGGTDSVKLLGNYSWNQPPADGSSYVATSSAVAGGISDSNIDAVCIRCHSSVGVHY